MRRLLLLSIISLGACDREIPFDEQGEGNNYLSCSQGGPIESRWRNVILDKTNQSVRSQKYFIYNHVVHQWGAVFYLRDNYDGSTYRWGEYEGKISDTFELNKTTLDLVVTQRITYDSVDDDYSRDWFDCTVYDDYQSYSKWENLILETLDNKYPKLKKKI